MTIARSLRDAGTDSALGGVMSKKADQLELCDGEATDAFGKEKLRAAYEQMTMIRRFEERAAREYASGRISGPGTRRSPR